MRASVFVLSLTLALSACGGAKKSSRGAKAGGGEAGLMAVDNDGRPGWLKRGSAAVTGESGRAFFGVGIAAGVRNPSLLRTTADNRARNELAKIFETFSASLMKDYMNSAGEQSVEQAVKTYVSMSLKGVEIVDHYTDNKGTLYALAKLDIETAKAVARAEELGAAKSYTTKVDVDDIFDQHSKKETPPAPPPPVASSEVGGGNEEAPESVSSGARVQREKPEWVDGPDPQYPFRRYLCGVGFAPDRRAAENTAYAALSRIFVAKVAAVSKDFMGAYSTTGQKSVEVQSSETTTRVATAKIFSGVKIEEIWEGSGTVYALACMDRERAATELQRSIDEADQTAKRHLNQSRAADKVGKVRELSKALNSLVERAAYNSELRIVHPDGIGVAERFNYVDVVAAFESAAEALKIAVVAEGPHAEELRGAMMEGLTERGFKVENGQHEGMDVLIKATITLEESKGSTARKGVSFVRGVILLEVTDVAKSKVLGSYNESRREGHRSRSEAERRAIRNLSRKLTGQVGKKIETAMVR